MIEIATDIRNECPKCSQYIGEFLRPCTEDSKESIKGLKLYQIVKAKLYGIKKPRSVKQLNTYWSCCALVAELLSDQDNIFSADDIDFKAKIRVAKSEPRLMKRFQVINGIAYIEPISIAFKNLKHLDACRYFDKALNFMAKAVGLEDAEELVLKAKERMG